MRITNFDYVLDFAFCLIETIKIMEDLKYRNWSEISFVAIPYIEIFEVSKRDKTTFKKSAPKKLNHFIYYPFIKHYWE